MSNFEVVTKRCLAPKAQLKPDVPLIEVAGLRQLRLKPQFACMLKALQCCIETSWFQKEVRNMAFTWCGSRVVYLRVQLSNVSLSFCQSNPFSPLAFYHKPPCQNTSLSQRLMQWLWPLFLLFHLISSVFPFLPASSPYCRVWTICIFFSQPLPCSQSMNTWETRLSTDLQYIVYAALFLHKIPLYFNRLWWTFKFGLKF